MNNIFKIIAPEIRMKIGGGRSSTHKRRSTHHDYFKLTAKITIALMALLITSTLPKTALAQQTDCQISQIGNVEDGSFQPNPAGKDYRITCTQADNLESISQLIDDATGSTVGESKTLIQFNNSNGQVHFDHITAAYEIIFTGTITNLSNDNRVISVSNFNEQRQPGDPNVDVVVENRAIVDSQGDGRSGFLIEGYDGADVEFTNYGTIRTSGDEYQRPDTGPNAYTGNFPNRRSDGAHVTTNDASGDVTLINHGIVTVSGKAARGLTGGVSGINHDGSQTIQSSGSVTIQNFGQVTTEGDAHEFDPIRDIDAEVYRPYGLHAYLNNSSTGTITITNEKDATVTTKGLGSRGISGYSDGSGAVTVTNKGTVTNTGGAWQAASETFISRPYGLQGQSVGGGAVTVLNEGTVTTGDPEKIKMANPANLGVDIGISGTHGNALMAVTEGAAPGFAQVTNRGSITTWGHNAHGMATWVDDKSNDRTSDPSMARGTNVGTITTHGDESDGASITVLNTLNGKSSVEVINQAGASVTTKGKGSEGIEAGFWKNRGAASEDSLGTARGSNFGTVTTTGDAAAGVNVGFWANEDDGYFIENSGNAIVKNYGVVTVSGNGSIGLNAQTHGSGNVDIEVQNGIVRAGTMADPIAQTPIAGKFGIGIRGQAKTDSSGTTDEDADTDIDVMILVSGSSAVVQAYGADVQGSNPDGFDEKDGIAILADSGGATGFSKVRIENGAAVSAFGSNEGGYAVKFQGGKGVLELIDSSLVGNISFSEGVHDDVFRIQQAGSGSIDGNIDFFGGDDLMTIDVSPNQNFVINGDIMGLETLNKTGEGFLRLNGEVHFAGSTLNLDEGVLVIAGQLNLGTGEMTVKKASKLIFEIGEGHNHGYVSAGSVHFDADNPVVYAQVSESENIDADAVRNAISATGLPFFFVSGGDGITSGTDRSLVTEIKVQSESSGGTEDVGTVDSDGMATFDNADNIAVLDLPEMMVTTSGGSSSGGSSGGSSSGGGSTNTGGAAAASSGSSSSSGGGAILGLGLLAVLLNSFVGDDDASASFGDYYFNTPQSAYIASINERGVMTIKETGNQPYQMWIRTGHTAQPMRMTGVSNTGVSGTEVGVNLYNSDTFYINTSVAPNVAAEVGSLNLAGKGEVYSLNSGWRNDRYFAGMRLSHGEFEVNSIVDNPIVNSALISNAKLRNTQAQLRAGMNLGTGALRFTPSAAVQVGTYESSEHVAESPALEAAIPSYAQDYTSVQLGLKMTSDKWLSFDNGSKWKPQLKFDSIHTDSKDAGRLTLRQSDKLGVLSFNTNAGLRSMPEVVNSMSFGAKVKSSTNDQAEWKFGFAGLEADGEEYYAAMAAYQLRF